MTTANCPTCGGPIEFKIGSSFLVVCPHCRSAIARLDRDLKDLGKVAALVETESPLAIGLAGKYGGHSFRLTGRAQLRHAMGGVWDEWYAAFDNNRWGWLAEAQGRFYMSFEDPRHDLPDFNSLIVGDVVPRLSTPLVVSEKGSAKYSSADGEIPYALVPNSELVYADLSGENGSFATVDYTDKPPTFYSGKEVLLKDLALDAGAAQPRPEKRAPVTNLSCPNCGGSLNLRAPDQTERVGCPYCGSVIDCTQGKFTLLQALKKKGDQPLIALGTEAEFEGVKQIVIGFMKRSCIVESVKYFWHEYLLYSKQLGFRWLVHSDNHWTYARPLQTAQVRVSPKYAYYQGKTFKRFQDAPATVESVTGEFYWKVTVGESVATSDFVCPPLMLSSEKSTYASDDPHGGGEINWSLGEYVSRDVMLSKFKLASLPRAYIVGACEPNPHQGWGKLWALALAAVFGLSILIGMLKPGHTIIDQDVTFEAQTPPKVTPVAPTNPTPASTDRATTPTTPPAADANPEPLAVWVSEPFDLNARQKIDVEAHTTLNNAWLAIDGALIDDTNGEVQPFDINVEYWTGVDEDGTWTEGSQDGSQYINAQPAGKYVLRLEGHWEHMTQPLSFHLKVEQTSIDPVFLFLAMFMVSILPAIMIVVKIMFESRRWNESMYGSSSSD